MSFSLHPCHLSLRVSSSLTWLLYKSNLYFFPTFCFPSPHSTFSLHNIFSIFLKTKIVLHFSGLKCLKMQCLNTIYKDKGQNFIFMEYKEFQTYLTMTTNNSLINLKFIIMFNLKCPKIQDHKHVIMILCITLNCQK